MIKKWFQNRFDHKISLRERMFRLATGTCMVALLFMLPMGRNLINLLLLVVGLVFMALVVEISIKKERINAGATSIAVLLLLDRKSVV